MVVAVHNVEAADCSLVITADSSKEMVVVVVMLEGVLVETRSGWKVVHSKLVLTRREAHNIPIVHLPGVEVQLLLLLLHSPSRTAKCQLSNQLPQWHLLLMSAMHRSTAPIR